MTSCEDQMHALKICSLNSVSFLTEETVDKTLIIINVVKIITKLLCISDK